MGVWGIDFDQRALTIKLPHAMSRVAVLPDGRVVSGSNNGALFVGAVRAGCHTTFTGRHSTSVTCMVVMPNGGLVSGSCDKCLRAWA